MRQTFLEQVSGTQFYLGLLSERQAKVVTGAKQEAIVLILMHACKLKLIASNIYCSIINS